MEIRILLCFLLVACITSGRAINAGSDSRPNVIIVMTDDQGYGDLGCHGNPLIKTPNLDDFHDESVRFTNFHVGTTCSPTRSMLMTGRDCNRVGVWHTVMGRSLLNRNELTIADVLKNSGYVTGMFGKWHLGDNYPFRPQDRGFDEVLIHGGGAIGNIQDYWGNDYFDDHYRHNGKWEEFEGYCTDVWFDEALKFIEQNKDRPFFCYIPTNAPHGPFIVGDEYKAMYSDKVGDMEKKANLPEFYGMISNIDDNFGKLVSKLQALDIDKNTILIYLTDNGTVMSFYYNAGMRGQKSSEYDGGHRVPFFIKYPEGKLGKPRDIDLLTGGVDIMPTILELCGITKPEIILDGNSLVPVLKGKKTNLEERIMFADRQRIEYPRKWNASSVMKGSWRLVNRDELYDISQDPGQQKNLFGHHPEIVNELTAAYDNYWESLKPSLEYTPHIILGSEFENPTWLTPFDIHGVHIWLQNMVDQGVRSDGFWAVEVEDEGDYEITLRSSSPFSDDFNKKPINDNLHYYKFHNKETGTANKIIEGGDYARLKLFDMDISKSYEPNATELMFNLHLKNGQTRLQAWFVNGIDAATYGVYFVGVKKID